MFTLEESNYRPPEKYTISAGLTVFIYFNILISIIIDTINICVTERDRYE